MPRLDSEAICRLGRMVIETEARAVNGLLDQIGARFVSACEIMLACRGRVVVTGMGKSGHIAGKIAATLASTGTPSFFVHPGEASHGDLGMITPDDIVLALSNSGESEEILVILPLLKRLGIPLLAFTGNPQSTLARQADVHLLTGAVEEACPLGLAPTSSTTAALALGDALAVALLEARGFTREDFAFSHPGGSLGRRLLIRVSDIMHCGAELPAVPETATIRDAIIEMTAKKLGMTAITDVNGKIKGIFTDGDLRRLLEKNSDFLFCPISHVMTRGCVVVQEDLLAAEALKIMEEQRINALLIGNENRVLTGALNMHDLLRAGVL